MSDLSKVIKSHTTCRCGKTKKANLIECPTCWRQVPHALKLTFERAVASKDHGEKNAALRMIIQWRKSAVLDEAGNELEIGMRIGCRDIGQRPSESRRGLTLRGYDRGHEKPYITDAGRFALAIKDHQPDMDEWRNEHVEESPPDFRRKIQANPTREVWILLDADELHRDGDHYWTGACWLPVGEVFSGQRVGTGAPCKRKITIPSEP